MPFTEVLVLRSVGMLGALTICTAAISMSCTATAESVVREVHVHRGSSSLNRPLVTQKHKLPYKKSWGWKSRPLGICTVLKATGYIKYTTKTGRNNVQYINQVVHSPRLTAYVYALRNGHCTRLSVRVRKFQIAQHWTGYSCSFNPRISVNAGITGLSVSISGWPSCGNRNQAIYSTSYGPGNHAIQDNTGSPISFGNTTSWGSPTSPPPPVCYGVFASAEIWKSHHSDSFGAGNLHASGKVCLSA